MTTLANAAQIVIPAWQGVVDNPEGKGASQPSHYMARSLVMEKKFVSLATACRVLAVDRRTLLRAIERGVLPALEVGPKALRIPLSALKPQRRGKQVGADE